ncbi:MAG TPA: hypothetical protein VF395_04895, partial [Polyangiaceae bacterium]
MAGPALIKVDGAPAAALIKVDGGPAAAHPSDGTSCDLLPDGSASGVVPPLDGEGSRGAAPRSGSTS